MEVGEVKLPRPVLSDVLIKNPLTEELSAEIDKEVSMLPKEDREKYLQTKIPTLWYKVTILEKGPECRISGLEKGSEVILDSNTVMNTCTYVENGEYLLFSERAIKAIW
jgi:hypothetical protein